MKEPEKPAEPEWKTKEERRAAFKELLADKQIKHNMKWDTALKLIQDDRRFNALEKAGERKQVVVEASSVFEPNIFRFHHPLCATPELVVIAHTRGSMDL